MTPQGVINYTCAITSPVLHVREGCNHTIAIQFTYPDIYIIRCRWAVSSECASICKRIPGTILNQGSFIITYESNIGTEYRAVALMIEDVNVG